jgi:hypothetical protein
LKFDFINYPSSGSNVFTKDSFKKLFGMAYIHMLDSLKTVLLDSETELALESFGFQDYITKGTEAPEEN